MARPKVVKLAQPGFDVKTAGDENLIYNSNWPLLKIYKSGRYTVTNFSTDQIVAEHDLGYIPAFWYFSSENLDALDQTAGVRLDTQRSEYSGDINNAVMKITNKKLIFSPSGILGSTGQISITWYIFALPLEETFSAPVINTGSVKSGRAGGVVFKLAKPGKSIDSKNLEDYAIHSAARSPLIHRVSSGKVSGADPLNGIPFFTVFHNLGYEPFYTGYIRDDSDNSYFLPNFHNTLGGAIGFKTDNEKVVFQYPSTDLVVSIIVFKDPFTIDSVINVTV